MNVTVVVPPALRLFVANKRQIELGECGVMTFHLTHRRASKLGQRAGFSASQRSAESSSRFHAGPDARYWSRACVASAIAAA
jgi:hypothetical protein